MLQDYVFLQVQLGSVEDRSHSENGLKDLCQISTPERQAGRATNFTRAGKPEMMECLVLVSGLQELTHFV